MKLIGGLIPEEGTVEVCMTGVWSSVCDSYWDYKDAFVICRQLGYPASGENDHFAPLLPTMINITLPSSSHTKFLLLLE